MQVYADAMGRRLRVAPAPESCALGAAVLAAAAADAPGGLAAAQARAVAAAAVAAGGERVYEPGAGSRGAYDRLYALYRELHDAFGPADAPPARLGHVMKELLSIREAAAAAAAGAPPPPALDGGGGGGGGGAGA